MSPERQFLILTSDSGFGHRASANAIAKALALRHPSEAVSYVVNPIFEESAYRFLQKAEENYDSNVKNHPSMYRFAYEVSDAPTIKAVIEGTLTLALNKTLQKLIKEIHPNAIISTNQMFNAPVRAVLNFMDLEIPFFTVVTDLAEVHSLWFTEGPDRFYVASERVRERALANGVTPQSIYISGIPVDPAFSNTELSRTALRQKLGLDPHLTTLLVVGSKRVSGIYEHLEALEKSDQPFQVAVIAGGDSKLYDKLIARSWRFPVRIENYVANIPEWMQSSDLLITKAGGLILSEGLAAGLPIILIDFLPGQEESNVDFLLDNGTGIVAESPADLTQLMDTWLADQQHLLTTMAAKARQVGHPSSALVIADDLWQATDPGTAP